MTEFDDRFKRDDGTYQWDRMDGESGKAYAAFCVYRDLGKGRSVDVAYWVASGYQVGSTPKLANGIARRARTGQWQAWSVAFSWPARATAYDTYLELVSRREREAKHLGDIDQYRDRQRRIAAASTEAALRLLEKANLRLKGIEPDAISPGQLPSFFRAAAAVMEASTNSEAQALALDELMRILADVDDGDTAN